jgi:hypothetical protein
MYKLEGKKMKNNNSQRFQNPPGFDIDFDLLQTFENNLDPQFPEICQVPCHVMGYGEISTVFELKSKRMEGLAFKRMSIFENEGELDQYVKGYLEYNQLLEMQVGLNLPEHGHAILHNPSGRPIFYIIQRKVPAHSIGNNAIHLLNRAGVKTLFERVLEELQKLWTFNNSQATNKVSLDGQISNWVIAEFDPGQQEIDRDISLLYVDTSTPVYMVDGVEQFDPEMVLRTTPSLLAMIIRQFFLEDVMARYYDPRQVTIDLLANFYKEQRPDMIPELLLVANQFYTQNGHPNINFEPIQEKEISDFYREDAFIWRFLASSRRIDRFLSLKIFRREYPYILPGKVRR